MKSMGEFQENSYQDLSGIAGSKNDLLATRRILNNKLPIFRKQKRNSSENESNSGSSEKKSRFSQIV